SADGERIASLNHNRSVCVWETATAQPIRRFPEHATRTTCLALSPDGKALAWAARDRAMDPAKYVIPLWDRPRGTEVRQFFGHENLILSVAFSPDGGTLVSGSADGTYRVWDVATGRELRRLADPLPRYGLLSLSSDGKTLATWGYADHA